MYLVGAAIAVAGTSAFVGGETVVWIAVVALTASLGIALVATRALVHAERDDKGGAARVVMGAIVGSVLAVILLAWLGVIGAPAMVLVGTCAVMTARTE